MNYPTVTLQIALEHGLTEEEYAKIQVFLGRIPTFVELGLYSVMWSEHCSYKNSILELKKLPKKGERVLVEAGEENAGLLDIGNGLAVCFKIESHNHPSAIEPYQGAATGVGGILRDIFTMGARPIATLNSLRFGPLSVSRNRELLRGVVKGIADYGNCFGVPTVGGEIFFDNSYSQNPLVNAMAVGIVEKYKIAHASATGVGNPVFIVGAATGRDGIHGATFASEDLSEKSSAKRPSVQIGDPFKEKLLLEATLELLNSGVIVGIQDMGAAGIACSCSETSARGQSGIEIDINKVTRRESGINAYEVCLSESQERMLVIVQKGKEKIAQDIFNKWDLHADEIGYVTDTGRFVIREEGEIVADVPSNTLVLGGDAPQNKRESTRPASLATVKQNHKTPSKNYNDVLKQLLASHNVASKRWIYQQYDHTIGASTSLGGGSSDAAVVRVHGTITGLAMTVDCNARFVALDPKMGTAYAVMEAARNVACTGAKPIGITNCLNFGNPMKPENYYFFREAIAGMSEACTHLGIPVTGGNVSFYNESEGKPVFPTPTIGMIGLIENVENLVTLGFKQEGDIVAILGTIKNELDGSEYAAVIEDAISGIPPTVDFATEKTLIELLCKLSEKQLIESAHDVSCGGLAVTLAEKCMSGGLGCELNFKWMCSEIHEALFSESSGVVVISISPDFWNEVKKHTESCQIPIHILGKVHGNSLTINDTVSLPIDTMTAIYESAIPSYMEETFAEV